jgi:hypothetical protein
MHGGKRTGAGRKRGSKATHTIEAAEARKILIAQVTSQIEPIVRALVKRARTGDTAAARVLFDRAFGKIVEETQPMGDYVVNVFDTKDGRLLETMRHRMANR